jgi:predicted PhzF superfamily epimerase YddE/YHI9
MKLPIYQVDAFTSRLFAGNPAAVVLLEAWLPDRVLAAIAAENNLAETAFVIPRGDAMPLRWFTPAVEVDLCGHATLATAHVLFRHLFPSASSITFSTKSGALSVKRDGDFLRLDFPARPGKPVEISDVVVSALGARPRELYQARDLMAVYETASEVRDFEPDFQRLATLDVFAVMITAPGDGCDYVCRFFAPRKGIPEDPVTGSASCTLVPYWASRLGKTDLVGRQLSPRGGELRCTLAEDRVLIAGRTVEYLRGEIEIDATA